MREGSNGYERLCIITRELLVLRVTDNSIFLSSSSFRLAMEPPSTELQDDAAIQDLHEPPSSSSSVPLSKNAQKKLAKAARFAEQKKERRAFEKEKKKQKKRERAAQQKEEGTEGNGRPEKKARVDAGPKQPFGARIVVDLGFDELMSENVSMAIIFFRSQY